MTSTIQELKQLLTKSESAAKRALIRELHELVVSVETPEETALRLSLYPLQTAAARIGQDLKIFQTLAKSGPKTLDELVKQTGAHPLTLGRLLRYMASVGHVKEVDVDTFDANQKCRNLADPEAVMNLTHFFENCCPLFQEMPAFLRKTNYQDVTDGKNTVFQPAYQTNLDTYAWFAQHPENLGALIQYMGKQQSARGLWLDKYPIREGAQGWDADKPVFVDIGGNVGHYSALFKEKFPDVAGRVILEDLPDTLTRALPTEGVEKLGHDFFQPQPIKGAKYYYLGWVLHNWDDSKSREILTQIKAAMSPESVLLINDMIIPAQGVNPYATAMDLIMLGACGSLERSEKQWSELLSSAGLKIKDSIVYNEGVCHGIIGATLA